MSEKSDQETTLSFKQWLTDRNVLMMMILILTAYAVDRFVKKLHNDCMVPVYDKIYDHLKVDIKQNDLPLWKKFVFNIMELVIITFILYLLTLCLLKKKKN